MKRSDFLKKLGIGLGVATLTPQILTAEVLTTKGEESKFAIDVESISHIYIGGSKLKCAEIMDIYKRTGFLIYSSYHGNAPIVIQGQIEAIDVDAKS